MQSVALQLRAEPLPLHLQRADGETAESTGGELAEAARNTTAYRANTHRHSAEDFTICEKCH